MKTPNQNKIIFEMSSGPALQISHLPEDQEVQVSAFPNEVCLTISVGEHIFALSELKPEQAKELVRMLEAAIKEAEEDIVRPDDFNKHAKPWKPYGSNDTTQL